MPRNNLAASLLPRRAIYTGDNLPVLRGIDDESVDLIYLDPPFNSGKQWSNPVEAEGKRAIGEFKDTWNLSDIHEDVRYVLGMQYPKAVAVIDAMASINGESWAAYLIYMGARLAEMRRILKPTGSIYYHCDPVMSHGVKLLMDAVFGRQNFRNEIAWCYTGPANVAKNFPRKHDIILFYARSGRAAFNKDAVRVPYAPNTMARRAYSEGEGGIVSASAETKGGRTSRQVNKKFGGGKVVESWWADIPSGGQIPAKERTGYPTQKPLILLERVIKASSNQGDIVLDPFCGCATTCLAAEKLGRHWIGIDMSEQAAKLVVERLRKESDRTLVSAADEIGHFTEPPKRADLQRTRINKEKLKPKLYEMQSGICRLCDELVEMRFMDIDHIVARSRGGGDSPENLQLLCRTCNTMKGDRTMEEARRKLLERWGEQKMQEWRDRVDARIRKAGEFAR